MTTMNETTTRTTTLAERVRRISTEPKHNVPKHLLRAVWKDEERREKLLLKPLADAARKKLKKLGIAKSKTRPSYVRGVPYHSEGYEVEAVPSMSEPHVKVELRARLSTLLGEKPGDNASAARVQAQADAVEAALRPMVRKLERQGTTFLLYPFETEGGFVRVPEEA